eukprot:5934337-Pleurochrysis_carterae.AAC.1
MSWLTVAVADGKEVGLSREGHRQADFVAQLVAKGVDGTYRSRWRQHHRRSYELRLGAGGCLASVQLLRCMPCSFASTNVRGVRHRMRKSMHGCELESGSWLRVYAIIHMLATGFIQAQQAKGGRVTGAEQLGLCRIASEVERVPVAGEEALEMRFTLGALQAAI